jgi:hypothetical protein
MNSKFHIVALDENGVPVVDKETTQSWAISEIQMEFDKLKLKMYTGEIKHLIFEGVGDDRSDK